MVPGEPFKRPANCVSMIRTTNNVDSDALDDDSEMGGDLPTEYRKSVARLQAPRRFKTTHGSHAHVRVAVLIMPTRHRPLSKGKPSSSRQQQQLPSNAANRSVQRTSNLHRSGGKSTQPNCEVYSTSSAAWIEGTYVAADEILPNKSGAYTSATGSTMQKLLKAESPHLRKKSIQNLTSNVPEAQQKHTAKKWRQNDCV